MTWWRVTMELPDPPNELKSTTWTRAGGLEDFEERFAPLWQVLLWLRGWKDVSCFSDCFESRTLCPSAHFHRRIEGNSTPDSCRSSGSMMSIHEDIACHGMGDQLDSDPSRCLRKVSLEEYERVGLDPCRSFCSMARINEFILWVESVYCWLLRIGSSRTIYLFSDVLGSLYIYYPGLIFNIIYHHLQSMCFDVLRF